MNRKGFTLVELLIVIAILGIIGGLATPTLIQARDRARVGEVTSQLVSDLERARSSSRRDNLTASISWPDAGQYKLSYNGKTLIRAFPTGIIVTTPNVTSITYEAPLGERTNTTDVEFTVARTGKANINEVVAVLGVTGKIYRRVP